MAKKRDENLDTKLAKHAKNGLRCARVLDLPVVRDGDVEEEVHRLLRDQAIVHLLHKVEKHRVNKRRRVLFRQALILDAFVYK